MKDLKTASLNEVNDFSTIAESIYKYIKKTWKCNVRPKGYKKFLVGYEDYDGMEELEYNKIEKDFKGFNDATAASPSFPIKIALPHTAYNATNQSRNPLRTLIAAILGHGMIIGEERAKRKVSKSFERLERTLITSEKYDSEIKEVKNLIKDIRLDLEMINLEIK